MSGGYAGTTDFFKVAWNKITGKPAFAPSDAQKNSDITKSEIEAKLTGDINSHTHSTYLTQQQIEGLR